MRKRTLSIRRWGVAALAGVTCLGAVALIGEGVASAAAVTSVSATAVTVPTILPTGPAQTAGNLTVTLTGTPAVGDAFTLTVLPNGGSCSSTNFVAFANLSTSTISSTAITSSDTGWTQTAPTASGSCGSSVKFTAGSTVAATTITLSGITYTTAGAASGDVDLTGSYTVATTGSTFAFASTASNADVVGVTVTATPLTQSALGTIDAASSNVTLTMPTVGTVTSGEYVCVDLTNGDNFDNFTNSLAVTQSNGAALDSSGKIVSASGVQVSSMTSTAITAQGNILAFLVTNTAATTPPVFVISGLHVDGLVLGAADVTVGTASLPSNCLNAGVDGSGEIFNVGPLTGAAIYGTTPDATTAAEFDAAEVTSTVASNVVTYTCTDNGNAVLATDAPNVHGQDALSAAYLEGQLGTGVLITEPTSLDPYMLAALKYAGVARVYVVGGLLAIDQADLTALAATPAYTCGGLALTGSNIQVFSTNLSGTSADDTAVAIDNYFPGTIQSLPSLAGAFTNASKYNQTTGNASVTGATSTTVTALVVSDTDWQDATAAGGIALKYHVPVIITTPGALSTDASGELTKLGVTQVIALGGQLALQPAVVTSIQAMGIPVLRIAGQDMTQTAVDLALFEAQQLGWADSTVLLAQGLYWSDTLGAAPLSGGTTPESLLTTEGPTVGLGTYTTAGLTTAGTPPSGLGSGVTSGIQVLGGPLAVPATQIAAAQAALDAG